MWIGPEADSYTNPGNETRLGDILQRKLKTTLFLWYCYHHSQKYALPPFTMETTSAICANLFSAISNNLGYFSFNTQLDTHPSTVKPEQSVFAIFHHSNGHLQCNAKASIVNHEYECQLQTMTKTNRN